MATRCFRSGTNEKTALDAILQKSIAAGLVFLSDEDARPAGSASPIAHLWDNGANAVDELTRLMEIRRRALDRFGERNIREGTPLSTLEDVLVPIYLLHRYQTEAVSKLVAGVDYRFALRGDGQKQAEMVAAGRATPRHGCAAFDHSARGPGTSRAAAQSDPASRAWIHAHQRGLRAAHGVGV